MRYTFKNSGVLNLGEPVNVIGHEEYSKRYHDAVPKALVKLGQLEDIEEELGIDLVTLFKAMKDGFYVKEHFEKEPWHCSGGCRIYDLLTSKSKREYFIEYNWFDNESVSTTDYGKTWALTKEELQ